ncbi:hypothetical protein Tco_1095364 [Tanacetum coccineum]
MDRQRKNSKFKKDFVKELKLVMIKWTSHLQFADDAFTLGYWSLENAKNLCRVLRCFQLSSGLKVNFLKNKLFGIGVTNVEVHNLTSILKLQPSSLLCTYIGLPLGANMNKDVNWRHIIEKFLKKLTSWKAKTLSYGGRLTLIKSVHDTLGIYFSIFKAPKNVLLLLEKIRRNFF